MLVFSQVMVLFFLMLSGFISSRLKITGRETAAHFSTYIMQMSLPAMLLSSFMRPFSMELLGEAGVVFASSIAVYGMAFIAAYFYPALLRIRGPERGVHRYAVIISNCGFIGYPMVAAIIGENYVFHAVIFNIPFNFLAYSVCAWLISKEGGSVFKVSWKTFINPCVIATFLGLVFFVFSLRLPEPLYRCFKMIGDTTSPLSMIVIGITLGEAKLSLIFGKWRVYVTSFVRLLFLPAAAVLVLYVFGLRGPLLSMAGLITAMPAGSSTSIIASLYNVAPEEAGSLVFLSTIMCIFTVPFVVAVMNALPV